MHVKYKLTKIFHTTVIPLKNIDDRIITLKGFKKFFDIKKAKDKILSPPEQTLKSFKGLTVYSRNEKLVSFCSRCVLYS